MAKRTKAQAAETREALLRAAREFFTREGFAGASLNAIAAAAGASKGAVFHHFPGGKEELFVEVWTQLQKEMDGEAAAGAIAGRSREDPYAAFLAGCRVYFDWTQRADYRRVVLIDGPSVLGMARWHDLDFELGKDNITRGTQYLASQGYFPMDLARPAAILLQAALNGAGFALAAEHPDVTPEEAFDTFERLLRGLR
ncbi:TetR family transcriptional regulator [Hyphomonas sp.]|uniref:TetR/AcrR family transcriptional regulator n=1 Tax=Hyphomonas sp. TaxID=87 RepID=UPI00391A9873